MNRVIYKPLENEKRDDGCVDYHLPKNGYVFDRLVADDWNPEGRIILYDRNGGVMLDEPFIHHFEGWEVQ